METLILGDFPLKTFDKVRYADTDRQGHVNNAVFATFLETGRVEVLYNPDDPILAAGSSFVIASLKLDFLKEINWSGRGDTGTGIMKIGNSSIRILQKLFQNEICVANAETTVVQVDNRTKKGSPLTENAKVVLRGWLLRSTN